MTVRALNAYREVSLHTSVSSANAVELVILVYERLIDRLSALQIAINQGGDSGQAAEKALELIDRGLVVALDMEKGGEISANLRALYDWASREILSARIRRDPAILDPVIQVFRDLESGWREISSLN